MFEKRDATSEEVTKTLKSNAEQWNACNPGYAIPLEDWQEKLDGAIADGYKSEVCSCGLVFMAFHHYMTCSKAECPFSDGVSLLERFATKLGDKEQT